MKILIVCSGNQGYISPFIKEQADALAALNNEVSIFPIVGKGAYGYLKNLSKFKRKIDEFLPDIIHAHYGYSGLLSSLANKRIPLIITFHGNDINPMSRDDKKNNFNRFLSKIAASTSDHSIFVNADFIEKINIKSLNYSIIPCHVDLKIFSPIEKITARNQLRFSKDEIYILFSSAFNNPIKNFPLAYRAIKILGNVNIIELKGYSRHEVNLLFNACDIALLTSINEGSPQFIKEAMACNCPIVATDVGDIKQIISGVEGCFITSFETTDVIDKIKQAINFVKKNSRTRGRERIIDLGLDSENIIKKIINVYHLNLK